MNALQQLLEQLQAAHVTRGPQEAPAGHLAALQAAQAGFAQRAQGSGSTGGMLAPDQPDAPDAAGSQAGDPLLNLINGFQKWSQSHGQGPEPLVRAARQVVDPGDRGFARVNQSGNARQGLGFQTYDLGHGRMAHVYYDPKTGKRQVIKFNKAAAA